MSGPQLQSFLDAAVPRWPSTMRCLVCVAISVAIGGASVPVDAQASEDEVDFRSSSLAQMKRIAEQTIVREAEGDRAAEFVSTPIMRYSDSPRKFSDATLWVWTLDGRPIAVQKVEAMQRSDQGRNYWGHCFASLHTEVLRVEWADHSAEVFDPVKSTVQPLEPSPIPDSTDHRRRFQARWLGRQFAAEIFDVQFKESQAMRVLPKPLFEITDPESDQFLGAMFALTTNGTNPDMLLRLEVVDDPETPPTWAFQAVRLTNGGIDLTYDGVTVWQIESIDQFSGREPTWMFFSIPRQLIEGEPTL